MTITAIIFDLDGTLVNSIPANYRAAKRAAAKFGIAIDKEDFAHVNGMSTEEGLAWVIKQKGGGREIDLEAVYAEKRKEQPRINEETTIYPYTLPALKRLSQAYTLAIATSGTRPWLDYMQERFGLEQHMRATVTASEVPHSKPDPRIFLQAAERIDKPAEECVVVEDSTNGIIAAKRAGMAAIAILTTTNKALFTGEAAPDLFIKNLGELDQDAIERADSRASIRRQAENDNHSPYEHI
ncbi:HAD family phosphatase [Candidatus Woesearchaeota archaeon]|nr:HAD family phosphatase [Candidatus Woesearchaeota archaeon]